MRTSGCGGRCHSSSEVTAFCMWHDSNFYSLRSQQTVACFSVITYLVSLFLSSDRSCERVLKKITFLIISLCSLSLLWVADAVTDLLLFDEGTLLQQLFHPERRELLMRANLLILSALFMGCFAVYMHRRNRLQIQLEKALAETDLEKSKMAAILAAIGDGVSIQDRDFRIVYQNQRQQEQFQSGFHRHLNASLMRLSQGSPAEFSLQSAVHVL